jgi:hypothetical protein
MDIDAKVDAYLLNFCPLFEFNNTDYGLGLQAGAGGNFWKDDSGELIDKKHFMYQAGAILRTKKVKWKLYYESARSILPLSYLYNEGVVLGEDMEFEKVSISNRTLVGKMFVADTIENDMFQNVLSFTGNLFFEFDKKIDYRLEIGNVSDLSFDENLFSLHLSFPMAFLTKIFQLKPQVIYTRKYAGKGSDFDLIVTDFADISKVPVDRNKVSGNLGLALETSAKYLPLKATNIMYVSDIFVAGYFDAGYYLPNGELVKDGVTSYSIGAGAGLNMFKGVSSMQVVYGYNHHSKWGFGFVVSKNI